MNIPRAPHWIVLSFLVALATASASDVGLVGHYTFDSDGSDSSPLTNDATLVGAVIVTGGVYGGAAEFDGTSAYAVVPHIDELASPQFTVSAWAKSRDPNVAIGRGILGKHREHNNVSYYWLYQYGEDLLGTMVGSSYGSFQTVTTAVAGVLNEWGMLTLTYDGSTMALYKNGVLEDTQPVSGYAGNTYDLLIGAGEFKAFDSGVQRWWDGWIDDVRIYNRALSAGEVLALYGGDTNVVVEYGEIVTTLGPQGALDAGAEWRLATDAPDSWRASGASVSNLTFGTYEIVFKSVAGWTRPANRLVEVTSTVPVAVSATYNEVTDLGLVLCYDFETPGPVIPDLSGHGNTGIVVGATQAAGYNGLCYEFNGASDYIRVPHSPSLAFDEYTVTAWVKTRDAAPVVDRGVIGKHREHVNINYFWLYQNTLDQIGGTMVGGSGGFRHVTNSITPFLNTWGFVAMSYDGSNVSLYVNGSLVDQADVPGFTGNTYDLLVGAGEWRYTGSSPQRWWDGFIDELKIYNRALSSNEVSDAFNGITNAPPPTGAVKVNLTPQGAPEAGATWRLSSESEQTGHASGFVLDGLLAGAHEVVFSDTIGWVTPVASNVTVIAGQTSEVTGVYGYASTNKLVLYFPFDELSGNPVLDESGYGNHGYASNVTFEPVGYEGGCFEFNGSNSYVVIPDDDAYDVLEFTVTMWAKSREDTVIPSAIGRGILGKHREHHNISYYWVYQYTNEVWSTMIGSQSGQFKHIYDLSPLYNTWGMVTLTYDGTNMVLYFNGQKVGDQIVTGYVGNQYDLLIGAGEWMSSMAGPQRMWNGWIDEVRIYSCAMDSNEVWEVYSGDAPIDVIPPEIVKVAPSNRHVTTAKKINVNVWAVDNIGVTEVTVNGEPATYQGSDKWRYQDAPLNALSNDLEIVARDAFGNSSTSHVWFFKVDKLKLKAKYDGIWEVKNNGQVDVPFTWDVIGESESGDGVVLSHDKVLFETTKGPKTVRLFVDGILQDMQSWNPKPKVSILSPEEGGGGGGGLLEGAPVEPYGVLVWESVTSQVYEVSTTDDLISGVWNSLPNGTFEGDGNTILVTNSVPFDHHIFYQVEISNIATNQ